MSDRTTAKIMILEDETLIALSTQQTLEDLGYEDLDVFYRLDPAIEAAKTTRYDAAVLDVNVDRGRTSLDLARALKADGTAILFASGNTADGDDLREIATVVLGKPYSDEHLGAAMKDLFDAI